MSGWGLTAAALGAAATWLAVPASEASQRRLGALVLGGETAAKRARPVLGGAVQQWVACAAAAAGTAVLVGGPRGLLLAPVVLFCAHAAVSRLEPADLRRRRLRAARDAPVTADLFAACLAGGADPTQAVAAIGPAVGGDVGAALSATAAGVTLGADQVTAWRSAARDVPALQPLARAVARSSATGAPLAGVVTALADEQRAQCRVAGEIAARQVGVRVAGPLGLCFLPAFVLIGVVPVVAGVARQILP